MIEFEGFEDFLKRRLVVLEGDGAVLASVLVIRSELGRKNTPVRILYIN